MLRFFGILTLMACLLASDVLLPPIIQYPLVALVVLWMAVVP